MMISRERSPHRARLGGWARRWGGLLVLAAALGLGGCEKIREAVAKAAKKSKAEESSAPGGAVLDGVQQLEAARSGQIGVVTGGSAEIRAISGAEFDSFVGREDRLVVIDFYADWCGPCRTLAPVLERVCSGLGGRVSLGKVNIDRERELAGRWNVRSIPDVRVFRGGKQVDAFVGALGEEQLQGRLSRQLEKLPAAEPAVAGEADGGGSEGKIVPMEKDWMPPGIERR